MSEPVTVNGLENLDQGLQNSIDSLENPNPLLMTIGEELVESAKERIEDEVDVQGKEFVLKPSTIMQKQRLGYTKKMQRTTDLKNSINYQIVPGSLEIGTDVEYADYLQNPKDETQRSKKEFIGISDEDEEIIESTIENYLDGIFE